ncbi:unnamed protein product [Protopolystoma xenopodis]|uniref:Dynein heavy chain linker domain-containing protein n=1 Tax=Protopolystoma xenopodis TaxID=117903 RepID=A0A3S5B0W0_9PLAT|nr:unnamed protein product [Protopolystoma xenopodis]
MELAPVLKWVRGDALTRDHWYELFRLIELPSSMRLEELRLLDLLEHSQQIVAQMEALRRLNRRAQAEVVVREALQEVETWAASVTFVFADYEDTQGRRVHLIKDWKDVISQVGKYCFNQHTISTTILKLGSRALNATTMSFETINKYEVAILLMLFTRDDIMK